VESEMGNGDRIKALGLRRIDYFDRGGGGGMEAGGGGRPGRPKGERIVARRKREVEGRGRGAVYINTFVFISPSTS